MGVCTGCSAEFDGEGTCPNCAPAPAPEAPAEGGAEAPAEAPAAPAEGGDAPAA